MVQFLEAGNLSLTNRAGKLLFGMQRAFYDREECMSQSTEHRILPELREHDFRSSFPVIGPLISLMRRILYNLTAKWGVWAVIQQQNRINRMIEERLHTIEALLVDLDRGLALLTRTVAEIEITQRQLVRVLRDQSPEQNHDEGA